MCQIRKSVASSDDGWPGGITGLVSAEDLLRSADGLDVSAGSVERLVRDCRCRSTLRLREIAEILGKHAVRDWPVDHEGPLNRSQAFLLSEESVCLRGQSVFYRIQRLEFEGLSGARTSDRDGDAE